MKRLSVCTDGRSHVFDLRLLDVQGELAESANITCRYCGTTWDDILNELERRETHEAYFAEKEEGECDT